MNNKINILLAGLLCFSCAYEVSAQWDTDTQNRLFVVINPEGCPVYSDSPSGNREIIDTLPFGKVIGKSDLIKVEYDTFYCGRWTSRGVLAGTSYVDLPLCKGYWVQIKYNGKVSWVWDGFLRNMDGMAEKGLGMVRQFYEPQFRSEYILLKAGVSHQSDFKYNPEWHWYGLSKSGCNTVLNEITGLSHFCLIDGDKMKFNFVTSAYSNYELDYIIGSKNKLTTGIKVGNFPIYSDAVDVKEYLNAANLWVDPISKNIDNSGIHEIYAISKISKKQKLESGQTHGTYGETQYGFENLLWYGDLDDDDKTDYLIRFISPGGDIVIRLFVSSAAKEGDLVAPVSELIYYEIP